MTDYAAAGDQPQAIRGLVDGLESGLARQTLLGVTGSGKSIGYDDPRVTFSGERDVICDVIDGVLSGAIQGVVLDRILRDNYRAPRRHADSDFGRRGTTSTLASPWGHGGATLSGSQPPKSGKWRTDGGL